MVARRYCDNIEQLRRIGFETNDRGHNRPKACCLSVESRKGACIERELLFLSNYGFARVRSICFPRELRKAARRKAVGSIPRAKLAALQNLLACPPLTLIIDNNGRSYSEGNHNRSVVRAAKTLARYARAKSGVLELTDNSGLPAYQTASRSQASLTSLQRAIDAGRLTSWRF